MTGRPRNVVVLGSTGSIGQSTLEVIASSQGRLVAYGLTAHNSLDLLKRQAQQLRPKWVVPTNADASDGFDWSGLPGGSKLAVGEAGLLAAVTDSAVDVVVAAIVGSAGLKGTWAAIEAGKTIALANKETLVMAGPLVIERARQTGATILPVDSEHSALFQALAAGRREDVKRVVLTASGGPFRNHSAEDLAHVTVTDALAHPTWNMGRKITIDSATLMNKALEIIEARWLFDLRPDQIDIVIHPQSIVHSLVEFIDGSVVAQLSPPDMRLPIQYALSYPERWPSVARKIDWRKPISLDFSPPDFERFPALKLGLEVAAVGGTAGAVLSAANEAAVETFLAGELQFNEIVPTARRVLQQHEFNPSPTLDELFELDRWAREQVMHPVSQ
jgi:1-deoxy-D-xylulose-5-phosphate reductoisomerase